MVAQRSSGGATSCKVSWGGIEVELRNKIPKLSYVFTSKLWNICGMYGSVMFFFVSTYCGTNHSVTRFEGNMSCRTE